MTFRKSTLPRVGTVLLVCLASVSLLLAQSSYWINHTIFDQEKFTQTTTTALLSEPSRDAIAVAIIEEILVDRPIAQRVLGESASSLISGLLGSDLSSQAVTALSNKAYAYVTASNRKDVAVDLTQIKEPLTAVIEVAQNKGVDVEADPAEIPDQVVLLSKDAFPDLSGLVVTMLWVSPLLWLAAISGFGLYIFLGRSQYEKRVYIVLAITTAMSVLGLALGPFIPPPIAAAVPNISLRPVAESLARGFITPFNQQMYVMFGTSLLTLGVFRFRDNIKRAIISVGRPKK